MQKCSGMQKHKSFREPPQYPVESVDHALALLEMVRDFGRVRISVAADLLGISASTAHRLMAMLVYRGYVEQDASRRYVPGPAMGLTPAGLSWTAELRHRARTHLEKLSHRVGETSNLVVLSGETVRFLLSVEPAVGGNSSTVPERLAQVQGTTIGDRRGVVLPAAKASGGKALLAEMTREQVTAIYQQAAQRRKTRLEPAWLASLLNELSVIRARGFATNFEGTESGVSAVGVAVHDGNGEAVAGLSVSIPQERFSAAIDAGLIDEVQRTARELEEHLHDFQVSAGPLSD